MICSSHFEPKYLIRCKQKVRLNLELDPVPTIYPAGHIPQASSLPTAASNIPRKAPRNRCIPDEYADFVQKDKIKDFKSLDHNCCPNGFTFQKFDDHVVYFRLDFSKTFVPEVVETIVVDKDLHVKLFYKGSPIPLPEWFRLKDILVSYQVLVCSTIFQHTLIIEHQKCRKIFYRKWKR